MSERLGCPVSYGLAWSYLVKLRHSLQVPQSQHALADPEEQEQVKKTCVRSSEPWPWPFRTPRWNCKAMDEHHIGHKPVQRQVWAPLGQRPVPIV